MSLKEWHFSPAGAPVLLAAGPAALAALVISPPGAEGGTVSLYDGRRPDDPLVLRLHLPAGAGPLSLYLPAGSPLRFSRGLFLDPGACDVLALVS